MRLAYVMTPPSPLGPRAPLSPGLPDGTSNSTHAGAAPTTETGAVPERFVLSHLYSAPESLQETMAQAAEGGSADIP